MLSYAAKRLGLALLAALRGSSDVTAHTAASE
jgi:hypothetical protein